MQNPTQTFDTRFQWQANADHHTRSCENHWARACQAERDRRQAFTCNEWSKAVGQRNTNVMWLSVTTGLTEDVVREAVVASQAAVPDRNAGRA